MTTQVLHETPGGKLTDRRSPHALLRSLTITGLVSLLVSICALGLFSAAARAEVETPGTGWEVTSTTFPTHLAPAGGKGVLDLDIFNIGARPSLGPITVTDVLPAGVLATAAGDVQSTSPIGGLGLWECRGNAPGESPHEPLHFEPASVVTCINTGLLPTLPIPEEANSPSDRDNGVIGQIGLAVQAVTAEPGTLTNHVTVAGGGAVAPASTSSPVTVSAVSAPPFGFLGSDGWFGSVDGTVDTQAGSHPYDFTYSFDVNTAITTTTGATEESLSPTGRIRNLAVKLPPGFVGNPTAVPQCTRQQLDKEECPASTQVGVISVGNSLFSNYFHRPYPLPQQVYNIVPPPGVPARFGFMLFGTETFIDATVRSGGDYGITAHANDIVQKSVNGLAFEIINSRLTLWGEPSDPAHDDERWSPSCQEGCSSSAQRVPFLTLPTACPSEAQPVSASVNTWEPGGFGETSFLFHTGGDLPSSFTGCDHLGFAPSISVAPDTSAADTPAGLTVDVHVPQEGLTTPGAVATSNIKDTTVALPAGLVINPGQAAGLQACQPSEAHVGDGKEDAPSCPNASKVGTVQIATPLLKEDLEGNVYVLQSNPPELKLLVAASGEGVNIKLVGNASLCEKTAEVIDGKACEAAGQIITKFSETPELPFTDFKLSFSGGAQAALATPTNCGTYSTASDFTPWSTPYVGDVFPSSNFAISSGPGGSGCPASPLPFAPSLTAGSTTDQAGGFTSFSLLLQSGDGQQRIEKLQFKAPQGLSGMLSAVPLCGEPQAQAGTCSAASQIGHASVAAGPGPYPLTIPQPGNPESPIYLTGPYEGAPFGLTIVTHVLAGPFNLGTIVTRARIEVDIHTAQITVTTDPLPQVVAGVPTDLRLVDSVIDRPGFMFNPTNCNPSSFSGTATGTPPPGVGGPGATAAISSHFQVGSCQSLKFAPSFKVSTSGKTSRSKGASLDAKVIYPAVPLAANQAAGEANIASVKVDLPKQLPSRLTTLQKACTAAQFNTNPAGCPSASVIGHATAITQVLPVPLVGPAYFVSHGGEAFPSLIIVLQGYGVTVDLVATTFISHAGITSSTFKTLPDVPFKSFDLNLPEGKYSALAANGNLCTAKLAMPTAFTGQNGAKINESTPIAVTGCKPAIRIVGHSVKGSHASIRVTVPSAGTLVATGTSIKRSVRRVGKAGTMAIGVILSGHDLRVLAKNPHQRVNVKVKLRFTRKHGAPLTAYVRLLMG
jgi:hypothetical protein